MPHDMPRVVHVGQVLAGVAHKELEAHLELQPRTVDAGASEEVFFFLVFGLVRAARQYDTEIGNLKYWLRMIQSRRISLENKRVRA